MSLTNMPVAERMIFLQKLKTAVKNGEPIDVPKVREIVESFSTETSQVCGEVSSEYRIAGEVIFIPLKNGKQVLTSLKQLQRV